MGAKWLELLKEIAPNVTRVAVLRYPAIAAGIGQFGVIQSVAPTLGVELTPVNLRDPGEIERSAWPASLCFFDHSDAGHDLGRRTITALESVVLDERQLERVKHAILLQSFDRCDLLTFLHRRQSHAGQNAPVIDMHGTRAALSVIARLFRTN